MIAGAALLALAYQPVGSPMPARGSARTHPTRQLDQIAASIRERGFTNPIVLDSEGRIIGGWPPAPSVILLSASRSVRFSRPEVVEARWAWNDAHGKQAPNPPVRLDLFVGN